MGCCLPRQRTHATFDSNDFVSVANTEPTSFQFGARNFNVVRVIGEGTYGKVYECSSSDGTVVALKVMTVTGDAEIAAAIENEISTLKHVGHHLNVASLIDVEKISAGGAKGAAPLRVQYVLMFQFVPTPLFNMLLDAQRLGRTGLPPAVSLKMLGDITAAVCHLHSLSPPVVHRDIKAENVLRTNEDTFVLCDFGSAVSYAQRPTNAAEIDALSEILDSTTTLLYRAPEQADLWARRTIGTGVDVWALGVLAHYVSFFAFPYEESALAVANAQTPQLPDPTHPLGPFIRACLTPAVDQRPDVWEVARLIAEAGGPPAPPRPAVVPELPMRAPKRIAG